MGEGDTAKNQWDKKEIIITVLVLLGGMALTAVTSLACKNLPTEKWLLKGLGVAVGYIPVFIIAAILFIFFCGGKIYLNTVLAIMFYAFFTGPSIFIVMALALLFLYGYSC